MTVHGAPELMARVIHSLFLGALLAACTTSGREQAIKVPLEITDNVPGVLATIDGVRFPLVLDLGGLGDITLTKDELERLDVTFLEETIEWSDAMGNVFESRKFIIPELELGGSTVRNLEGHEYMHAPDYAPQTSTGYIGEGLLRSYTVLLNYAQGLMVLYSPESKPKECRGTVVPFLTEDGVVTPAITDIGAVKLVWDTGATFSVMRANLVQSNPNGRYESKVFTLSDRDFGPLEFALIDFAGPPFDGFVGYNFFQEHVVCIDFANSRLFVRRNDSDE